MSSTVAIDRSEIHQRAYARWQQRGCPVGSPEHDWFEAEQELVHERQAVASVAPLLVAAPSLEHKPEPVEKKPGTRIRSARGRVTSPLTLGASEAEAAPESKVHARAGAIPRPSKRRKVAR
jgi:hypothetical protein